MAELKTLSLLRKGVMRLTNFYIALIALLIFGAGYMFGKTNVSVKVTKEGFAEFELGKTPSDPRCSRCGGGWPCGGCWL